MRKIVVLLLVAFIAGSCDKEETINMSLLQEYNFVFEAYRDYHNDDLTIDEFTYSFDSDSVTISGPRYEIVDNNKIPGDIVSEKWPYFLDGNAIYFFRKFDAGHLIIVPESISPLQYQQMQWKVLSLDETHMSVDIMANSTLAGHAEFKVAK